MDAKCNAIALQGTACGTPLVQLCERIERPPQYSQSHTLVTRNVWNNSKHVQLTFLVDSLRRRWVARLQSFAIHQEHECVYVIARGLVQPLVRILKDYVLLI
jgi:hypothetical protein